MVDQPTSTITIGEIYGKQLVPNITIEDAKFWGRPNYRGEEDRFKDSRRKFNVLIPNEHADTLRGIGYPVKTLEPTPERLELNPDEQPLSFLKVMIDDVVYDDNNEAIVKGPKIIVVRGQDHQRLDNSTMAIMDRADITRLDLELRAWNYNAKDIKEAREAGLPEPKPEFSCRLETSVAVLKMSILADKYSNIL